MKKLLIAIALYFVTAGSAYAQAVLTNVAPTTSIDFSSSMQNTVGYGTYTGAGFSPTSTAGRLNSNAWEILGWENGNLAFGGAMVNPAHARGSIATAVVTDGLYAYTDNPHSPANPALLIQASDNNSTPGSITLRVRNGGTANMTQLEVSYDLFVRNDEASSTAVTFSHSADNIAFNDEAALAYASPGPSDMFQWTPIGVSPMRSIIITGINIAPNAYYYVRWSTDRVSGTGNQDEIGLDNISLTASYGAPAPEINVVGGGLTILHNDMTPRVADGTEFANTFTGGSQSFKAYIIQNLGGLDLNVSNVTIGGDHPGDFSIHIASPTPPPTGNIPAIASGVISTRELNIRFSPTAPGIRSAIISIANTDANENPYIFKIQGLGVIPQPDIDLNGITGGTGPIYSTNMIPVTTNNTLFDTQVVGGSGQVKDYRIRNNGTAALLVLQGTPFVQIGGANPADFTVVTQPNAASVFPNFSKTFTIRFNPTAPGIRTAIVTIPNNDVVPDVFGNAEGPFTFMIQGTGVAPEMDVFGNNQPIVDGSIIPTLSNHTQFDNQNIATGFQDRVYTIRNTGNHPLTVGTVTLTGSADFTVQTQPSATVAVGASTTFSVRFNPSTTGLLSAVVNIPNNDYNENPYDFVIRGYGLDYIPCTYGAVETIAIQDFEVAPATPVWTYSVGSGAATAAAGTGYAVLSDGGMTNRFLGARSLQVNNSTAVVNMAAINTSQYNDIELVLKLSSLSTLIGDGNDFVDKVTIAVSTNGTIFSNELQVTGNTDAKWSFASGTGIATASWDGNNAATVFDPGSGGFLTTTGYGTMSLTGLPKSATLYIRIYINNNANEVWAIDNVSLFGRREIFTQWNGTSWSNLAPTPSVKAVINGTYDTGVYGNIQACKCEVNATVGNLIVRQGNNLVIESELENLGVITLENGGSLVQKNDLAINTGVIRVRRFTTPMTRYDYTYWSSPVVGQSLFNLSPLTQADKYYAFNPLINNWENVVSSSIMAAGKGYIIRAPQNFDINTPSAYTAGMFVGVPNNGFIQTPILGGSGAWNLIGNPYASAINADLFIDLPANVPVMNGTLYFWTHNTPITNNVYTDDDYAVYNKTGGTAAAPNSGDGNNAPPNGSIASGQGFFVEALSNGQAVFNNSMRVLGNNMQFFRSDERLETGTQTTTAPEKSRAWINLSNDQGAFKQALIGYVEGATDGLDRNYDGTVLDGGNVVSWYSILEDKKLSIQGKAAPFHDDDVVPMGYVSAIATPLSITLENVDGDIASAKVYVEDKQSGIIHDLTQGPYAFTTEAGTFDARFLIRFSTQALSNPDFSAGQGLQIAVTQGAINMKSTDNIKSVLVFDLLGRKLFDAASVNAKEFSATGISSAQQSLIVKVILENDEVITQTILYP